MDELKHAQVKSLFFRALEYNQSEIRQFLSEQTKDKKIIELVIELVETYHSNTQHTNDFVREVAENIGRSSGLFPTDRYILIKKIGQGGMGEVFLAQRKIQPITNQVAIKILSSNSQVSRENFTQEMKILSQLSHPNICQFIDADFLSDGRPYVVMEYSEGQPITDFCVSKKLSVEEIIRIIMVLCETVQHAHANLVVHRDIKPHNVLVQSDHTIKLLDFGIAKILENSGDKAITQLQAMTPAYASPEQILRKPINVASDVYSLGVLLYELLTHTRPFDLNSVTPLEYEKMVKKLDPQRPSKRVNQNHSLKSKISGDLDAVVLKALAFDVNDRYQTVGEFREDLNRVLENRPVKAKRNNWFEVANKFVARNNPLVLIILAFAAFIFLTFKQKIELNQFSADLIEQASELQQQKVMLQEEKVRAKYLVDSLSENRYADPHNVGKQNLIIGQHVNIATGYLYFEKSFNALPEDLDLKVFYNSNYALQTRNYPISPMDGIIFANEVLGKGWDHNYSRRIFDAYIHLKSEVSAYREDGSLLTFKEMNGLWENGDFQLKIAENKFNTSDEDYYSIFGPGTHAEQYNWFGQISQIETADGQIANVEYGRFLQHIETQSGDVLTFTMLADGMKLGKVIDQDDRYWTFKYDERNNLSQIVNPDGSGLNLTYSNNLLTNVGEYEQSNSLNLFLKFKYDPFKRVYRVELDHPICGQEYLQIAYHNDMTRTVTNDKGQVNTYMITRKAGVWSLKQTEETFDYLLDNCQNY